MVNWTNYQKSFAQQISEAAEESPELSKTECYLVEDFEVSFEIKNTSIQDKWNEINKISRDESKTKTSS